MIHYTCDSCKCSLDPEHDLRYVLRMEIYAAVDDTEDGVGNGTGIGNGIGTDADSDNLQEIQELLECLDDADEQFSDDLSQDIYKQLRFDLCANCRQRILRDPVGRHTAAQFNFSEN